MKLTTQQLTKIAILLSLLIICSMITIPLGAVPITLQTLAVLLIGLLAKPIEAVIVTTSYLVLGLVGLPIFAGGQGGFQRIFSPAFGFIISFIVVSWLMAVITKKNLSYQTSTIAVIVGTVVTYLIGLSYLAFIFATVLNTSKSFVEVLQIGLLPFIPGDILKAIIAVMVAPRLKRFK